MYRKGVLRPLAPVLPTLCTPKHNDMQQEPVLVHRKEGLGLNEHDVTYCGVEKHRRTLFLRLHDMSPKRSKLDRSLRFVRLGVLREAAIQSAVAVGQCCKRLKAVTNQIAVASREQARRLGVRLGEVG